MKQHNIHIFGLLETNIPENIGKHYYSEKINNNLSSFFTNVKGIKGTDVALLVRFPLNQHIVNVE